MRNESSNSEITIAASQYLKEKKYWTEKLAEDFLISRLPYSKNDYSATSYKQSEFKFEIPEKIALSCISLANNSNPRLHMILCTSLLTLINKYNSTNDIVIGTPIDKQEKGANFINTILAIRAKLSENISFKDLLIQVKDDINNSINNQNFPIKTLIKDSNNQDVVNESSLFDIAFLLENIQTKEYIDYLNLGLIFSFNNLGDKIEGTVYYNSALYNLPYLENVIEHFCYILDQGVSNVNSQISDIKLLTESNIKILEQFNNTKQTFSGNDNIVDLFIKQAEKAPDSIALEVGNDQITYKELDFKSDQIKHRLLKQGIKQGSVIAYISDTNIELVSGIIGIMKAGLTYLPISPDYPIKKIEYYLKDANVDLVLVNSDLKPLEITGFTSLTINEVFEAYNEPVTDQAGSSMNDLAYIIYTSGSTGKPKGVLIEHGNISNQMNGLVSKYSFEKSFNHLLLAPITFDPSIQQIFLPLITGGKLYVPSASEKRDLYELAKQISLRQINLINTVPSIMNILVDQKSIQNMLFEYIILAGEVFTKSLYNKIHKNLKYNRLINIYGPTEATINTTLFEFNSDFSDSFIPIGKPLTNYSVKLLNENGTQNPVYIPGEICIQGKGVGRGYLNQPELTFDKFIQSTDEPEEVLYKTGDIGNWLEDGNIHFIERNDSQIKIRGVRVELGEIQSIINSHPKIDEAVVTFQKDERGEVLILAYYVSKNEIDSFELKKYLLELLPEFMIPAFIIELEKLPLTTNGKVDMKALPDPISLKDAYVDPRDEVERMMVKVWAELLNVNIDKIGITSNFFEFGGHSLNATILVSKIFETFDVKIPITEIFSRPTPEGLCDILRKKEKEKYVVIEPAAIKDTYVASPAQLLMYWSHYTNPDQSIYNVNSAFKIKGEFNIDNLYYAVNKLIERHEILRTSFVLEGDIVKQKIHDKLDFEIEYIENVDLNKDDSEFVYEFVKPFDLTKAPLFRLGLIKKDELNHILIIDIHHIIVDGMSVDILIRELIGLYKKEELPQPKLQYKDYSEWLLLNKEENSKIYESKLNYWLDKFSNEIPVLKLPYDNIDTKYKKFEGQRTVFKITEEVAKLKKMALEEEGTLFMILMAVYNILLSKLSLQDDIIIGTPVAGRLYPQLEDIPGNFINTIAIRSNPNENKTFKQFLAETKSNVLKALDNQDIQFEELVEELNMKEKQFFNCYFAMENNNITELSLPQTQMEQLDFDIKNSKFDLTLLTLDKNDELDMVFEYSKSLFKEETVLKFIEYFKSILSIVIDDINISISDIKLDHGYENTTLEVEKYDMDFEL